MKKVRIKRSHKKRVFPTPAFLPGIRGSAKWHIREVKEGEIPHTLNLSGGEAEMALPLGDSDSNKFTRLHELLHAAHSPIEEPRPLLRKDGSFISLDALMIAEELRINMVGRAYLGGGANMPEWEERYTERALDLMGAYKLSGKGSAAMEYIYWLLVVWPMENGPIKAYTRALREVDNILGLDKDPNQRHLQNSAFETTSTILDVIWKDELADLGSFKTVPSWDSVLKLAAFLQDVSNIFNPASDPSTQEGEGEKAKEDEDIQKALDLMRGQTGAGPAKNTTDKIRGIRRELTRPVGQTGESKKPIWGKMVIRKVKMAFRLPKNKLARSKYRATDEGANPRFPHRMLTDGKVFSRKKRVPGGSVLIDDSGSMSWTTDELKEIILAAPATIIGAYSGVSFGGELVVVAEDGRYADIEDRNNHPIGGGNIVDLPALEWLAAQPKPRIWVSDSYVVPLEGSYEAALEECLSVVRDYDINICFTVKEAGEVFRGEKEIYR